MPRPAPEQHSPAPTPERAVYGFVLFLLSYACLALYLVWAILPDHLLASLGLEFLPQKYWAVALPIYVSVVFFTFVLVIYPSLGMLVTPGPTDIRNVTDGHAIYWPGEAPATAIPPVSDIHLSEVAKMLENERLKKRKK